MAGFTSNVTDAVHIIDVAKVATNATRPTRKITHNYANHGHRGGEEEAGQEEKNVKLPPNFREPIRRSIFRSS